MMNFYEWLMREKLTYYSTDSGSQLASNIVVDKDKDIFKRRDDSARMEMHKHLMESGASTNILKAFEKTYDEYRNYKESYNGSNAQMIKDIFRMIMKVVVEEGGFPPERAHDTDAGMDLKSPVCAVVRVHDVEFIATLVRVEIPKGYYRRIASRSGLFRRGLQSEGVVDCGYTGKVGVTIHNNSGEDYTMRRGDKIVQMIVERNFAPEIEYVDKLDETERGEGGFGSTGR